MTTHSKTIIFVTGVLVGITVSELSAYGTEIAIAGLASAFLQSIVVIVGKKYGSVMPLLIMLFSIGLFFGIIRGQLVTEKIKYVCETNCTFSAIVVSSPEIKNDYQIFNVHPMEEGENILDVQIRTPLYPKYKIGETLSISGKVLQSDTIAPHKGQPAFDYSTYLLTKNIGSEILFPKIEVIDSDAHTISDILGRWKESMVEKMNMHVASPASSLATGMLFGNSSISKELTQTFRVAGLSHIIVLSGFNIAIVISFILFVFAFLPLVIRISLASASVIFFVMMVEGGPSVIRATLMAFVALLATLVGREYVAKQALVISLLLIVLYEPYALLHDVSLHLSFLATAGVVFLSEPITSIIKRYMPKITSETFLSLFTTTLSAYFATLPYVMHTFGTISPYALLANILVLPFVPVAMFVSFLTVCSSYVSEVLASVFGFLDSMIINIMIWIAEAVERLPFSYLNFQTSWGMTLVVYGVLFVAGSYLLMKPHDETSHTTVDGFLTDTISY
jgi:competence protein ComEC